MKKSFCFIAKRGKLFFAIGVERKLMFFPENLTFFSSKDIILKM
jgi:hypothetical protein